MSWLQLSFECERSLAQSVSQALDEGGALSVTLLDAGDEPVYEPAPGTEPLWSATRVVGLFDDAQALAAAVDHVGDSLAPGPVPAYRVETLEDRDWDRECRDQFVAMAFGRRLWVCPTWSTLPEHQEDAVIVVLDPGVAFGTGTHPTTALCLEWLDQTPLEDAELVDYGCGSGILAVAGAKLGAHRVWAADTDPQALGAARANCAQNGVASVVRVVDPDQVRTREADCLVANILANPLITLAPRLSTLVRAGGRLALSGILVPQASSVMAAYEPWFHMAAPVARDEWVRLDGRRRDPPEP